MLRYYGILTFLFSLICCSCEQKTAEANQELPLFSQYIESSPHSSSTTALVHLLKSHYQAYQQGEETIQAYPYIGGFMALVAMDENREDVLPIIKELHNAGADINMSDETGITPLHFAALLGDKNVMKWLVDKGVSIQTRTTKTGASVVMYAAWGGHVDIVKELLEQEPKLRDKDNMGQGIHIYAAFGGSTECLKYLKDMGLDITEPGNNGVTPIISAANKGNQECISYLEKQGCNLYETAADEVDALMYAAWGGNSELIGYLLNKGFSVTRTDKNGNNALHHAAFGGHSEVISQLCNSQDAINAQDNAGLTPLMVAATQGNLEVVKILMSRGANPYLVDNRGMTAADIAGQSGIPQVYEELSKAESSQTAP